MSVAAPFAKSSFDPMGGPFYYEDDLYQGPNLSNTAFRPTESYRGAGDLINYVEQWNQARHHGPLNDPRVLEAISNLTMDPGDHGLAADVYSTMRHSQPLLELNHRGRLDYHVDVDNLNIPPLDVDPNDAMEEINNIVRRYGHLDYAQGGLVDAA
jgi:hypothetical protein